MLVIQLPTKKIQVNVGCCWSQISVARDFSRIIKKSNDQLLVSKTFAQCCLLHDDESLTQNETETVVVVRYVHEENK